MMWSGERPRAIGSARRGRRLEWRLTIGGFLVGTALGGLLGLVAFPGPRAGRRRDHEPRRAAPPTSGRAGPRGAPSRYGDDSQELVRAAT